MELKVARARYHAQKTNARNRNIGWHLTFQQWLDWWGDDLDRRGIGVDDLQMQRFADTGPYALENIRKGTPKQNGRTRSAMMRKRRCDRAAAEKFANEMAAPTIKHEPKDAAMHVVKAVAPVAAWDLT